MFYVWGNFACMYVYVLNTYSACVGEKGALDPLALE